MDNTQLITYSLGQISFPNYEEVIEWAKEVADTLNATELREDNVKEVKASLAAARKVVDGINARRIEVKKALLTPYETLETQVKVITGIINDADTVLRDKVRAMEEREREQKELTLLGIWNKRADPYAFPDVIPDAFHRWLTPQHLNKTSPISKSEQDMTAWMEQREQDIKVIRTMPNAAQILIAYTRSLDLSSAITEGNQQAEQEVEVMKTQDTASALFEVTGDTAIKLVEYLFKDNNINYRRIK